MKTIYYQIICAICIVCGITSCSDFLEIKPQNEILFEDFWSEKADVENVVTGCYSALSDDGVRRRMMIWGEARTENVMASERTKTNADPNLYSILKEDIKAMNSYTTWDGFYDVINRCNTVMKYAPGVAAKDPSYTQSDLKATIAEVTALRSLCYFYLIRTFRDVPFSREAFTDDDQKMDLEVTPFAEVLDNLITDLEAVKGDAVKRYPEVPRSNPKYRYQTGRITQDAIHSMLCELYLWKGDYDQCINYADLVINSKKLIQEEQDLKNTSSGISVDKTALKERLEGYPLVNDNLKGSSFGDAYETIFADGASKESIFELSYDSDPERNNMTNNSAISALYGHDGGVGLLVAGKVLNEDYEVSSSRKVFADENKKVDARMYSNCDCTTEGGRIMKYAADLLTINATSTTNITVSKSYFTEKSNGSPWIIYRLADIMLMKAEALCEKMDDDVDKASDAYNKALLDTAYQLVNVINKRSICKQKLSTSDFLKAPTTKTQLSDLVKRERQRELMFEGKRWFDLVRYCLRANNTNAIVNIVANREDVNKSFAQNFFKNNMNAIFWPYNNEELKVNRNLVPNPAFSSGENTSIEKSN